MPFLALPHDPITLFYRTNLPNDDISRLDPSRPTIILLNPIFMDSSFMAPQLVHPILSTRYNLIAFDQVSSGGQTIAPIEYTRDAWVDAAIIAQAHDILNLPPCHFFCSMNLSLNLALRIALLWPHKVLSLCLCGVPSDSDEEWAAKAYQDLLKLWAFAADQEEVEESNVEFSWFLFNGSIPEEEEDQVVAHWQTRYSPRDRTRLLDVANEIFARGVLTNEEFASIRHPTLIFQGDSSVVHPFSLGEDLRDRLCNSNDGKGALLHRVQGGAECLSFPRRFAAEVNTLYLDFLNNIPPSSLPPVSPFPPGPGRQARMLRQGLLRLSQLKANHSLLASPRPSTVPPTVNTSLQWPNYTPHPDGLAASSFLQTPPEAVEMRSQYMGMFKHGIETAFVPFDKDGVPTRRFSERHMGDMFSQRQSIAIAPPSFHVVSMPDPVSI